MILSDAPSDLAEAIQWLTLTEYLQWRAERLVFKAATSPALRYLIKIDLSTTYLQLLWTEQYYRYKCQHL